MELLGSRRDFVFFLNEYFKKFHQCIGQMNLSGDTDQSIKDFFTRDNLEVAKTSVKFLHQETKAPFLGLVETAERVISASFHDGVFSFSDFKKGIEIYRLEFLHDIKSIRVCPSHTTRDEKYYEESLDDLDSFVRTGYLEATYFETIQLFIPPLSYELQKMAEELQREADAYFKSDH